MLCLIELGRRRVISGHSRDIGLLVNSNIWNIELGKKGKEFGDRAGKGWLHLYRLRTICCLAL